MRRPESSMLETVDVGVQCIAHYAPSAGAQVVGQQTSCDIRTRYDWSIRY
jgi:hypothetical protein